MADIGLYIARQIPTKEDIDQLSQMDNNQGLKEQDSSKEDLNAGVGCLKKDQSWNLHMRAHACHYMG